MSDYTMTLSPGDTLTVKVPAPSPSQVIKPLPTGAPFADFMKLYTDNAVDVIECAGTYQDYRIDDGDASRRPNRLRPLIVRAKAGATAIFDGMGHSGGFLKAGANAGAPGYPTFPTTDLTFDGLSFQNYALADDGLFYLGWVERIRLLNLKARNITGIKYPSGQYALSHIVYVSVGGDPAVPHARSKDIVIADMDALGDKTVNGVQSYRLGNVDGLQVLRGTWAGLNRFFFADGDPINVLVDGAVIANCNATIDAAQTTTDHASGVVKNCRSTGSGPMAPGQGFWKATALKDGGGNVAA